MRSVRIQVGAAALLALTATACGTSAAPVADSSTTPAAPTPTAPARRASAVTPPEDAVLAAARTEGTVLVYGNADDQTFAPIVKAFEAKYPFLKAQTLGLDDTAVYQRYLSEKATGARTADVLLDGEPAGFLDLVAKGEIQPYRDPNLDNLPDYAVLAPGVSAISEDPLVAVFNRQLLPEAKQPTSLTALAEMSPSLKGKVVTGDIENLYGYGATYNYTRKGGEAAWGTLQQLGPNTRIERKSSLAFPKIAQGEYQAGFFLSGAVRAFITGDVAKVLNYRYLTDGTVVTPRGVGLTTAAEHPNAGKVFINFLLSVEGQQAACQGGLTPYRDGVDCALGLDSVKQAIGADNVIVGTWSQELVDQRPSVLARWKTVFTG